MITPPRYEARLLPPEQQIGKGRTHGLFDTFVQAYCDFVLPGSETAMRDAARRHNVGYERSLASP